MTKSAADAEREVETSRGDLNRTVEALKEKMSPGQLWDEAIRSMGGSGNQVLGRVADQARANPLPLAVIGIGLAWLMSGSGRASNGTASPAPGSTMPPFRPDGDGVADRARDLAGAASDKIGAAKDSIAGATSSTLASARERAAQVSSAASDTADQALRYSSQARRTIADLLDREPILIGGAAFLVGLAVGAAAPVSDVEKRYVGPVGDEVMRKGKQVAEDTLDKLTEAAQSAYGAAKEAVVGEQKQASPGAPSAPGGRDGSAAGQTTSPN